jgi:hypothetical protein
MRGGTELTVMTVIDRFHSKESLEKKEGTIKNGQSRETDNIGYTRRRQIKMMSNKEKSLELINMNTLKQNKKSCCVLQNCCIFCLISPYVYLI